jgi:hypothetical protein
VMGALHQPRLVAETAGACDMLETMALAPRSDDPLELRVAPPGDEYALLEFALEWDSVVGAEAQLPRRCDCS